MSMTISCTWAGKIQIRRH